MIEWIETLRTDVEMLHHFSCYVIICTWVIVASVLLWTEK